MTEIDNYQDTSAHANDDVESNEESSRDTQDTRDEDDDPMSLPICAREISSKPYNLMTWMDELGSFPVKISYSKKSLDSLLPNPRLLRLHTTKSDNIIEGDPFKYKGGSTKTDEVNNTTIDALKANLKGVIVLILVVENEEDEILAVDEDYTTPTLDEDGAACYVDEILPLAIVDENLVAEKLEEKKVKEKEQEKLEENVEEGLAEKGKIGTDQNSVDVMGNVMQLNDDE
ncbi:hypothetical protein H5410_050477 [Solanum commersonii]|uniref:Uncharacterized protein n=1 Tax=Solanum commersonii TaxID=4109 RepID=A0A9J5WVM4_SOLCO|nr:hypothetical protein H5410_050477 [Solanum commersonii]